MLIAAIALLAVGAYLRITSYLLPLDILCFGFGCIFAVCFVLSRIKKAFWKVVRLPMYILLILVLVAMAITLIPIKKGVESQPEKPCSYLILLGCKVEGDVPSPALQDRINTAYDYLLDHPKTICIASGGMGSDEQISEAQCIYNALTDLGISGDRIWLEDKSTCTSENFSYSLALIQEKGGETVLPIGVLSNDFHLYRASLMAKDNGLDAIFVAAPTTGTANRIGFNLREIFALWKYLLIGE